MSLIPLSGVRRVSTTINRNRLNGTKRVTLLSDTESNNISYNNISYMESFKVKFKIKSFKVKFKKAVLLVNTLKRLIVLAES